MIQANTDNQHINQCEHISHECRVQYENSVQRSGAKQARPNHPDPKPDMRTCQQQPADDNKRAAKQGAIDVLRVLRASYRQLQDMCRG